MMIYDKIAPYQLILGSASPRRRELLKEAGFSFSVLTTNLKEEAPAHFDGKKTAEHIAREKANALRYALDENDLLITADTEVWLNYTRFGKPQSLADARDMLYRLSGNCHDVISGVCFTTLNAQHCFTVTTEVFVRELSNDEITHYLNVGNPLDKAGAYGIQEWLGLVGIDHINGSYTNVVGFPMTELYLELEKFIDSL